MVHPLPFGRQVGRILGALGDDQTAPGHDLDAERLDRALLGWVGRQQHDRMQSQVKQDPGSCGIVPRVGWVAQDGVGVHRVQPPVLQGVGTQLLDQTDASTLMAAKVDHGPTSGFGDQRHREVQLLAAVTSARAQRISGQTLGVQPHHWPRGLRIIEGVTANQGDMLVTDRVPVAQHPKGAVAVRQDRLDHAVDHGR